MMKNLLSLTVVVMAGAFTIGCSDTAPGQCRDFSSNVDVITAATVSRDILQKQNYLIDADATSIENGIVKTLPRSIDASKERVLSNSAARQLAQVNIRRTEGRTLVYLYIETQRRGSSNAFDQSPANRNYNLVPTETPAQTGAATTAEQNEVWNFQSQDTAQENKILNEISATLNAVATTQPTPADTNTK